MNRRIRAQRPSTAAPAAPTTQVAASSALSLGAMRTPDVLSVQSAAGNRVARVALQRSMAVGAAGDAHEVEADAVAREIVSGGQPSISRIPLEESITRLPPEEEEPLQGSHLQRYLEEEELQMSRVQRAADEEELQMSRVQREAAPEVGTEGGSVSGETSGMVEAARGRGQALDPGVQREMEGHFGADFSGVRVHQGSQAADLNIRLSARAFTTGNDIFVGQGGLNPGSKGGKELLAHELTHVVQQGGAKRKPRRQP